MTRRRRKRSSEPTLYFAYGSNLHLPGMRARCPDSRVVGTAKLEDWKLVFKGVADIEPDPGNVVWGGLWSCSPLCMRNLDRYEGVRGGFYERKTVTVLSARGPVEAVVYVMCNRDRIAPPSQFYLSTIVSGYKTFHLPTDKIKEALDEVQIEMERIGAIGFEPVGKKRMRPILPEDEPDDIDEVPVCPDDEVLCEWDSVEEEWFCPDCGWVVITGDMSPATIERIESRHPDGEIHRTRSWD